MKQVRLYKLLFILFILLQSCEKFLDKKSDQRLAVPATLQDAQALLDYSPQINVAEPPALEICSDDYYNNSTEWASYFFVSNKRLYLWQDDQVFEDYGNDWSNTYRIVYYSNTVLEILNKIERTQLNQLTYDNIKGQALFHRGKAFLEMASLFTLCYDAANAGNMLGIPLRLNTDFNETAYRASLADTYTQLLNDLTSAASLLPAIPVHKLRASKPAAFAMLSRAFLYMQQYEKAGRYADSSLQLNSQLLNYNTLSTTANFPFAQFNAEVLFSNKLSSALLSNPTGKIDSILYNSYRTDDLRKNLFFKNNGNGTFSFKGSYEAGTSLLHGPCVDEMYLTRAECNARQGMLSTALLDLNTLLKQRYKTNTYADITAATAGEAVQIILTERRKELVMRGLRWMDVKRLNKEGYNITMQRIINNELYTLPPNSPRTALAIPEEVIRRSGMVQNPR